MNRRDLFKKLILVPLATVIGINIKPKFNYKPTERQAMFFSGEDMNFGREVLYGINDYDIIYNRIRSKETTVISSRSMRIPLQLGPIEIPKGY